MIDHEILVPESGIAAAMRLMLEKERVLEGAAALAVAAYLQEADRYRGKKVAILLCGRNISAESLRRAGLLV